MDNEFKQTNSSKRKAEFYGTPTAKLIIIAIIGLILLIPQSFTTNLIHERQSRLAEAEEEVTDKWSRAQTFIGPYIAVPYTHYQIVKGKDGEKKIAEKRTAYFFPDELDITGKIDAQSLQRGIFDIVVYTTQLAFEATFEQLTPNKLGLSDDQMSWEDSYLVLTIDDLRGIGEHPEIVANDQNLNLEPFSMASSSIKGLQAKLSLDSAQRKLSVSGNLNLKGSKSFEVVPIGKTSTFHLSGNWPSPSFQGSFLPESRTLLDNSFESDWTVLHFNRPFGQEFNNYLPDLSDSKMGLSLHLPADQYQQSIRTSKYAILIISLSFLALFLMEIFTKKPIHPLQYTLVGFALVLYYTLLIAFSEQFGFQVAYLISSLATVGLLAFYSLAIFKKPKNTAIFTSILVVFYGFIFVIVKQQDYALLIGSIGLFLALAVTMAISRKIDWYSKESEQNT